MTVVVKSSSVAMFSFVVDVIFCQWCMMLSSVGDVTFCPQCHLLLWRCLLLVMLSSNTFWSIGHLLSSSIAEVIFHHLCCLTSSSTAEVISHRLLLLRSSSIDKVIICHLSLPRYFFYHLLLLSHIKLKKHCARFARNLLKQYYALTYVRQPCPTYVRLL